MISMFFCTLHTFYNYAYYYYYQSSAIISPVQYYLAARQQQQQISPFDNREPIKRMIQLMVKSQLWLITNNKSLPASMDTLSRWFAISVQSCLCLFSIAWSCQHMNMRTHSLYMWYQTIGYEWFEQRVSDLSRRQHLDMDSYQLERLTVDKSADTAALIIRCTDGLTIRDWLFGQLMMR